MDNSVIAKSGWLLRKNSNLIWERNWVELYRDGYLKYYENDESPNAEETIFMPNECIAIKTGSQVEGAGKAPVNHSPLCIFSVTATGSKHWILCGESLDDMRAWQLALEQSRLIITRNHAFHYPMPSIDRFPLNCYSQFLTSATSASPASFPYSSTTPVSSSTNSTSNNHMRPNYLPPFTPDALSFPTMTHNPLRDLTDLQFSNYLRAAPFFNDLYTPLSLLNNSNLQSQSEQHQQQNHHPLHPPPTQQQINRLPNQFPLPSIPLMPPPVLSLSTPNAQTIPTTTLRAPTLSTTLTNPTAPTTTVTTATIEANIQRSDTRDVPVGMLAGAPSSTMWTPYRWW